MRDCLGGFSENVHIVIGAEKQSCSSGEQDEHGTEGRVTHDIFGIHGTTAPEAPVQLGE